MKRPIELVICLVHATLSAHAVWNGEYYIAWLLGLIAILILAWRSTLTTLDDMDSLLISAQRGWVKSLDMYLALNLELRRYFASVGDPKTADKFLDEEYVRKHREEIHAIQQKR